MNYDYRFELKTIILKLEIHTQLRIVSHSFKVTNNIKILNINILMSTFIAQY